jgi:1-deoxy-D-xylulose-5-phosphate reductoisomerase
LSAANEVVVEAFLAGQVRWPDIAHVTEHVMAQHRVSQPYSVDDVLAADAEGRRLATEALTR